MMHPMIPILLAAGEAARVDPTLVSLIGNWGPAGAVVVVVWFFLGYLKSDGLARDRRYDEAMERQDARYGAAVERLGEKLRDNSEAMRAFSQAASGICKLADRPPGRRQA